jgi:hypothetical protein
MSNTIDLSALVQDRDFIELDDGRCLRLRIEPDDLNPFEDFDCYGKLAQGRRHEDTGREIRPDGFDGNAEKLSMRSGGIWWQPPSDGPKRGTDDFAELRRLVLDLDEFGMVSVKLEILDGKDAYGQPIVVNFASMGGIEPYPGEYLAEIISELAAELELT